MGHLNGWPFGDKSTKLGSLRMSSKLEVVDAVTNDTASSPT